MASTYSARISTASLSIFLLGVENALTSGSGLGGTPRVSGRVDGWMAWGGGLGGRVRGQWEGIKYRRRRPSQPLLLLSPLWVGVLASSGRPAGGDDRRRGRRRRRPQPLVYVFLPLRRSGGSRAAPRRRRRRRRRPPPRPRLRPPIYAPGAPRLEQVLVDAQGRVRGEVFRIPPHKAV